MVSGEQVGQIVGKEIGDTFHSDIRRWIGRESCRIERKLSLPGKDRSYTASPGVLDGREDAQFIIDQHVVVSRISVRDIFECLLLVNIDENLPLDGFKNAGALDLARLEYHVAVCQNDRPAPLTKSLQDIERTGVKAVGERVIDQKVGRGYQVRLVRVFYSEALQSPQVVAVAKMVKEFLLDRPKSVPALGSEFALDVPFKVGLNAVVLQQSVVHVHQKNNRSGFHGKASTVSVWLSLATMGLRPVADVKARKRSKREGVSISSVERQRQLPAAVPGRFIRPSAPRLRRS